MGFLSTALPPVYSWRRKWPEQPNPVTAMSIASLTRQLRVLAKRFARADKGNVATMFAIAVLPLMGLVGAAVDYSRVASARSTMQAALDSTALMLSKDLASGTISKDDISAKAQLYFSGLYTNTEATVSP